MASEPPQVDVLTKRTFTTITTTGNELIKRCRNAIDEDKLPFLVEGLENATKEYLSIMLEKLDLPEILTHSPEGKFLYNLDMKSLFERETEEVTQVKVNSLNVILFRYFMFKIDKKCVFSHYHYWNLFIKKC